MIRLLTGDCLTVLPTLPDASVDAVVTDPPYPEISRGYGRMTEPEWHEMMHGVVTETRRVLKPHGSAMFVLQANQERVGRTRPWLWEFMAWIARDWNMVQDCWWWNPAAMPTIHSNREYGLMRPSVKACVWAGEPDCYRNQSAVMWAASESVATDKRESRALVYSPSGSHVQRERMDQRAREDGITTPFNLLPLSNTNSQTSGGALGHGAATPDTLCRWWISYLTKPGDTVLDMFGGSGTVGLVADQLGRDAILIERDPVYVATALARIEKGAGMFADVRTA